MEVKFKSKYDCERCKGVGRVGILFPVNCPKCLGVGIIPPPPAPPPRNYKPSVNTDSPTKPSRSVYHNEILREVHGLLEQQTKKGLEKYGNTVNPDEYTTVEWVDHARQEALDFIVYLTILKKKLKGEEG